MTRRFPAKFIFNALSDKRGAKVFSEGIGRKQQRGSTGNNTSVRPFARENIYLTTSRKIFVVFNNVVHNIPSCLDIFRIENYVKLLYV